MQISIPKPCPASWDAMSPETNGRHCAQCAKTVVDFTSLSDEEIASYLSKNPGSACGRFHKTQLNRPLAYGLGILAALSGFQTAAAQTKTPTDTTGVLLVTGDLVFHRSPKPHFTDGVPPPALAVKPLQSEISIRIGGIAVQTRSILYLTVLDPDGKPLAGVLVDVHRNGYKYITDESGGASLWLGEPRKKTTINLSYPNMAAQSVFIRKGKSHLVVTLQKSN